MAFEFIREELTEAKYIRRPSDTTGRNEFDIAESFFEHLLVLQQLRYENPSYAQKYAKDTLKYMNFSQVRTSATDLHNLASILNNPTKYTDKISNAGSVQFDELQFKRYLRDIASGKQRNNIDRTFLLRMQKNLGIRNSFLKNARRIMGDYGATTPGERKGVTNRMITSFRQDNQFRSDIFKPYANTAKRKGMIEPEQPGKKGPIPGWVKTAALMVGAYQLGKKF
jgi:hypothetical protein